MTTWWIYNAQTNRRHGKKNDSWKTISENDRGPFSAPSDPGGATCPHKVTNRGRRGDLSVEGICGISEAASAIPAGAAAARLMLDQLEPERRERRARTRSRRTTTSEPHSTSRLSSTWHHNCTRSNYCRLLFILNRMCSAFMVISYEATYGKTFSKS